MKKFESSIKQIPYGQETVYAALSDLTNLERLKDKLLETRKVDIVAGPDAYRRLPEMLAAVRPDSPQIDVLLSRDETYADISPIRTDRNGVSAFISIMR